MRISDWSSDVCSSDLSLIGGDRKVACHQRSEGSAEAPAVDHCDRGLAEMLQGTPLPGLSRLADSPDLRAAGHSVAEMGRASWWVRVCPYVWIWVVAGSLKNNQTRKKSNQRPDIERREKT